MLLPLPVTRQEIYEEFGTRQGLAEAYVIRDVMRMIAVPRPEL